MQNASGAPDDKTPAPEGGTPQSASDAVFLGDLAESLAADLSPAAERVAALNENANRDTDGRFAPDGTGDRTGGRQREPETRPSRDRYGSTDTGKLAANPKDNIKRGSAAMDELMRKRGGMVENAMYREETGWIAFEWGDPGDPASKPRRDYVKQRMADPGHPRETYQGGHGLSHIAAKHPQDLKHLAHTLANGSVHRHGTYGKTGKLYAATDTHFAVLLPFGKGRKTVLTEFEPTNPEKIGFIKKRPLVRAPGVN